MFKIFFTGYEQPSVLMIESMKYVVSITLLALLAMIYLLVTYLQIGDSLREHLPQ